MSAIKTCNMPHKDTCIYVSTIGVDNQNKSYSKKLHNMLRKQNTLCMYEINHDNIDISLDYTLKTFIDSIDIIHIMTEYGIHENLINHSKKDLHKMVTNLKDIVHNYHDELMDIISGTTYRKYYENTHFAELATIIDDIFVKRTSGHMDSALKYIEYCKKITSNINVNDSNNKIESKMFKSMKKYDNSLDYTKFTKNIRSKNIDHEDYADHIHTIGDEILIRRLIYRLMKRCDIQGQTCIIYIDEHRSKILESYLSGTHNAMHEYLTIKICNKYH